MTDQLTEERAGFFGAATEAEADGVADGRVEGNVEEPTGGVAMGLSGVRMEAPAAGPDDVERCSRAAYRVPPTTPPAMSSSTVPTATMAATLPRRDESLRGGGADGGDGGGGGNGGIQSGGVPAGSCWSESTGSSPGE
jgi:hypothetical protein